MSERRKQLIQIIPGIHDIEEINSVVVKLDANSTSDLISKSLARFLGCKVKRENGQMALVEREPMAIYGNTQVLIRLPPSPGKTPYKFIKVVMKVTASLKTNIMISKSTQILLGILPTELPHEGEKAYQAYRKYIMHKDMMKIRQTTSTTTCKRYI